MAKRKIRILFSPTLTAFILLMVFSSLGIYIFTLVYENSRQALIENIALLIFWTLEFGVLSIIILLIGMKTILSVITIDETGISRSFLGRFYKLHIPWDDLKEVCFYVAIAEFLVFSKTKVLSNMPISKWHKVKDTIFMSLSKRRYAVIAQYLQQPIVGMPDKVKERLTKEKQKKK